MHHTALADRLSRMDGVENAAKHEYKMAQQQVHSDNAKVTLTHYQGLVSINIDTDIDTDTDTDTDIDTDTCRKLWPSW